MTEAEWLFCNDPRTMLDFLRGKASDRKLRLFAVACCLRIRHLLTNEWSWEVVEVVEKFADGALTNQQTLRTVQDAEARLIEVGREINSTTSTEQVVVRLEAYAALDVCRRDASKASLNVAPRTSRLEAFAASLPFEEREPEQVTSVYTSTKQMAETEQSQLLREIFGNPSRKPPTIEPLILQRNDTTIPKMAQLIYNERRFEDMPILADALMDAGCHDDEMLNHCRSEGPHVRGCWVIDLILAKK